MLKLQAQLALKEQEEERRILEHGKKQEALKFMQRQKEEERFKQKQAVKQ